MKTAGDSIVSVVSISWPGPFITVFSLWSRLVLCFIISRIRFCLGFHLHQGELASEAQGMASVQMLTVWRLGGGGDGRQIWVILRLCIGHLGRAAMYMLVVLIKLSSHYKPADEKFNTTYIRERKGISSCRKQRYFSSRKKKAVKFDAIRCVLL